MFRLKLFAAAAILAFGISACFSSKDKGFVIGESKEYGASLFRQNCAICHGPEGEGKTLDDGTIVPSLRQGEFKAVTEEQIYDQISEGGNGMTPFRTQLSEREMRLLVKLVHDDLRKVE